MEDTDKHWQLWGALDPYRGVCYPGGLTKQFWESGEAYVDRLIAAIDPCDRQSALDFGCGVGRILRALAGHFDHVTGVDISTAMLAEAHKNVPDAELLTSIPARRFSLVHSCLVLQHIPIKRGLDIIRQLRDCVAPRGVLAIHFPVNIKHSLIYQIKHAVPVARYVFNVLQRKSWREPLMQMNTYSVEEVSAVVGTTEYRIIQQSPQSVMFVWSAQSQQWPTFHRPQGANRN